MAEYNIAEILQYIDPTRLDYQEWLSVGMALKDAGYSAAVWDGWSARDSGRYHPGECERKWSGFLGAAEPVTAGTIVQMARDQGWTPPREEGYALDWDAAVGTEKRDAQVVIDKSWIEGRDVREPEQWEPARELTAYLEALFETRENVGYVTRCWRKDGKYLPRQGCWDRSAGRIITELQNCGGDIGQVLGDYDPDAGAWIRFNPLDGKGCKNDNVADFRFALVESDDMEIDKQNAIIRELELPVACLVHSGGKSLHAIVRVEAKNYDEYRKRVDYLYGVCRKNGLNIDGQNKNPSRLSRMPGVTRGGRKQFLIDTNIGKGSWAEWVEWIESVNDDLPEPENIADVWDALPELSPPLIEGVLRQGHKMLLAGPSKAGKSFALIELCIAIAEGRRWLAWQCAQGRVMYVNLELDRASCLHRFRDVYDALGVRAENLQNIDIWNLRGNAIPMDKLAPKLIRRAAKKHYIAVVIDPIYKIITGDENSADQMAAFCNQFDRVCTELGCAVVYCHHHSKGTQGSKKFMDRASGSGVFARDPDALLDLLELEISDALRAQDENSAVCEACAKWLDNAGIRGWRDDVDQDRLLSRPRMLELCKSLLSPQTVDALTRALDTEVKPRCAAKTAWRIEGTLREFAKFAPVNLWFDYPTHKIDESGVLGDISTDSAAQVWKSARGKKVGAAVDKNAEKMRALDTAYAALAGNGPVSLGDIMNYMGCTRNTVKDYIDRSGKYTREKGVVIEKE